VIQLSGCEHTIKAAERRTIRVLQSPQLGFHIGLARGELPQKIFAVEMLQGVISRSSTRM
jgi:hypothetical protein